MWNRRKNLIPVNFVFDTSTSNKSQSSVNSTPVTGDGDSQQKASSSDNNGKKDNSEHLNSMCPSCKKEFSNHTLMFCVYSFYPISY